MFVKHRASDVWEPYDVFERSKQGGSKEFIEHFKKTPLVPMPPTPIKMSRRLQLENEMLKHYYVEGQRMTGEIEGFKMLMIYDAEYLEKREEERDKKREKMREYQAARKAKMPRHRRHQWQLVISSAHLDG